MRKELAIKIGPYGIEGPAENAAKQGEGVFGTWPKITIGAIVSEAIPLIFAIAGILLFVYFLLAGIDLIKSGGDPKTVEAAKARLTNALVGAAIIAFAYLFIRLIQTTLTIG